MKAREGEGLLGPGPLGLGSSAGQAVRAWFVRAFSDYDDVTFEIST